jgi:hypothetical protein
MKILALILLMLCLQSSQVYAEWAQVKQQTTEDSTLYADYSSIEHPGNTPTIWIIIDYNTVALSGSRSTKIQLEFDCAAAQRRFTAYMTFTDHMAQGDHMYTESPAQLAHEPYMPVSKGSAVYEIMLQVCANIKET